MFTMIKIGIQIGVGMLIMDGLWAGAKAGVNHFRNKEENKESEGRITPMKKKAV